MELQLVVAALGTLFVDSGSFFSLRCFRGIGERMNELSFSTKRRGKSGRVRARDDGHVIVD